MPPGVHKVVLGRRNYPIRDVTSDTSLTVPTLMCGERLPRVSVAHGPYRELHTVGRADFGEDDGDLILNRLRAQPEPLGNLWIRAPVGDQLEDLSLPFGQRRLE